MQSEKNTQSEMSRQDHILEAIKNFPLQRGTPNLMSKVIPRGKTVFILKKDVGVVATAKGIIIPDSAKEDLCLGVVVAVGPEVPDDIKIGQLVGYNRFANMEVNIEGQSYLRMFESDVYYFINPEGQILHIDHAADIKRKENELQAGRKENARVIGIINSDTEKKLDEIRDKAKNK